MVWSVTITMKNSKLVFLLSIIDFSLIYLEKKETFQRPFYALILEFHSWRNYAAESQQTLNFAGTVWTQVPLSPARKWINAWITNKSEKKLLNLKKDNHFIIDTRRQLHVKLHLNHAYYSNRWSPTRDTTTSEPSQILPRGENTQLICKWLFLAMNKSLYNWSWKKVVTSTTTLVLHLLYFRVVALLQ